MYILDDIITYIRRLIKTPSNDSLSDSLLIDYINRFWINDVDARLQVFDLKTKYQFITSPGVDQYNMPLYSPYNESVGSGLTPQLIQMYPVYQGFTSPCYINGIDVALQTQKDGFYNIWPNIVQQNQAVAQGNGGTTYTIQIPLLPGTAPQNPPFNPILRGHVDITGIMATGVNVDPPVGTSFPLDSTNTFINIPTTSMYPQVWLTSIDGNGNNVVVADSGFFLTSNVNCGLLMQPGPAPTGNKPLGSNTYNATTNVINYLTGQVNVTFPVSIPNGNNINANIFFFQTGLPRALLLYNNVITLRNVPDSQYLVELDAYLSPAAFLNNSTSIQFGYMSEYIARGAARKILSDTGDIEQFQFYEPFFKEQESLVWKRSQRQWTATRTESIYSQGLDHGLAGNTSFSGGTI